VPGGIEENHEKVNSACSFVGRRGYAEELFVIKFATFRAVGKVECGIYGVLHSRFFKLQMLVYELF